MKALPEPPPLYKRPKERWFENHNHLYTEDGEIDISMMAVSKTLNAMWLMLHDRTQNQLPSKPKMQNPSDMEHVRTILKQRENIMSYWGDLCNNADSSQNIDILWQQLLIRGTRNK